MSNIAQARIVAFLRSRWVSRMQLCARFGLSRQAVTHHLKNLRELGLESRWDESQIPRCKQFRLRSEA